MRAFRQRFDGFVAGPGNQAALAAARAAVQAPGEQGRLLVISGGTGLGKTHLLLAVMHAARTRRPPLRTMYFAGRQIFDLLRHHRRMMPAALDLLVVDDLDRLGRQALLRDVCGDVLAEATARCRQVVIGAAEVDDDVRALLARCAGPEATRTVELAAPDLATRIRILERRARCEGMSLPRAVARLVAERIAGTVLELEAALVRLGTQAFLGGRALTLTLAEELIAEARPPAPAPWLRERRPLVPRVGRERTAFVPYLPPPPRSGEPGSLLAGVRDLVEFIDDVGGGRIGGPDVRGQDILVPLTARDGEQYTLRMRVERYLAEPVSCDFVDERGRSVQRAWPYPADDGPFRSPTFICTPPTAEFYQWHPDRVYRRGEGTLANTVAAVYAALQAPEYAGRFTRGRRV